MRERPTTPSGDPNLRDWEYEPGYDWRTDPYYTEDAIRSRMKATKAKVQPASVSDRKDNER